jgi:hypothetical protein
MDNIFNFSLGITWGVPGPKIYNDVFMVQNHPRFGSTFKTKGRDNSSYNTIPLQLVIFKDPPAM